MQHFFFKQFFKLACNGFCRSWPKIQYLAAGAANLTKEAMFLTATEHSLPQKGEWKQKAVQLLFSPSSRKFPHHGQSF
jgi:hypothetical protein